MLSKFLNWLLKRTYPRLFALQRIRADDANWIRSVHGIENIPFNGDVRRTQIIKWLASQSSFDVAIETGTWVGNTTQWLLKHFPRVISIETDKGFVGIVTLRLGNLDNLQLLHGESQLLFPDLLKAHAGQRVFVYLDAHARENEPPVDVELTAIAAHKDICVLIDDFRIPDTEFGYGRYGGIALDLTYARPFLPAGTVVYGPSYPPDELTGKKRGWALFSVGPLAGKIAAEAATLGLRAL